MKKKLSKEQYWKWFCRLNQSWLADAHKKEDEMKHLVLQKDMEIALLKANLFKEQSKKHESLTAKAAKDYADTKAEIEESLHVSLEGCAIDDVTLEIRKL